jgi:hypothetical protein
MGHIINKLPRMAADSKLYASEGLRCRDAECQVAKNLRPVIFCWGRREEAVHNISISGPPFSHYV